MRLNLSPRGRGSHGKTRRGWGMPWIRRLEVRAKAEWPEKDLTTKSAVGKPNRRRVTARSNPRTRSDRYGGQETLLA